MIRNSNNEEERVELCIDLSSMIRKKIVVLTGAYLKQKIMYTQIILYEMKGSLFSIDLL